MSMPKGKTALILFFALVSFIFTVRGIVKMNDAQRIVDILNRKPMIDSIVLNHDGESKKITQTDEISTYTELIFSDISHRLNATDRQALGTCTAQIDYYIAESKLLSLKLFTDKDRLAYLEIPTSDVSQGIATTDSHYWFISLEDIDF